MSIPWTPSGDEIDDLFFGADGQTPENHPSMPDLLATMFEQQKQHMGVYGTAFPADVRERAKALWRRETHVRVREFAGYTVEELYEAINLLKAKPWKKSFRPPDRDKFMEEIADMWHFLIEMHIIAGITPEEIFQAYFRKTAINVERQNGNY